MRHYPADSPKSAARVIALTLLADGAIDPSEMANLSRRGMLARLAMSEAAFEEVIHELCDDLVVFASCNASGRLEIGREVLRELLAEVRHRRLRRALLGTMHDIAHADGELTDGEALLIALAAEVWHIDPFDAFRLEGLPLHHDAAGVPLPATEIAGSLRHH